MSTAGKVLSVLVMLVLVVWIALAAGVSRLNTNGNEALDRLRKEIDKLRVDVDQTQVDIAGLRDQTSTIQEKVDHDLTVLRDRQVQLEKTRSQIVESLERYKYQLATVEESVKSAQRFSSIGTKSETPRKRPLPTRAPRYKRWWPTAANS